MISRSATIVGDADVLVALYFKKDALHKQVVGISRKLFEAEVSVIFPNTAIAEGITALHRKLSNSTAASLLNEDYKKGIFEIEYTDEKIMQAAAEFYNPEGSKQNTFFDALVAATAKKLNAKTIFSFDDWYKKLGFNLASDLKQ